MKMRDILTEFDLHKPIQWISKTDDEWRGTFGSGDQRFLVVLKAMKKKIPGRMMEGSGVRLDFGLMSQTSDISVGYDDLKHQVRDDNTGQQRFGARAVYSHVLSATLEYLRERKPGFVFIHSDILEKTGTYQRMALALKPRMAEEGYSGMRVVGEVITFWADRYRIEPYFERGF